jgi:prepilin-type N-terminal cleavage/methylation domain-containing protein
MKTIKRDLWRVTSDEVDMAGAGYSRHPSPVTRHAWAFTLIELLVVISIIAVLAALILPVAGQVKRQAILHNAQAEMSQIETAIERYKSAYGFYPPCNTNNALVNPLYFELVGTTNDASTGNYETLDGGSAIAIGSVSNAFDSSIGGFVNCNKPNAANADESAPRAQNFLPELKSNQIAQNITNQNVAVTLLVSSIGGPDPIYQPLGFNTQDKNPWRYNSANPTNNPGSYDLYIQLRIAGKTNLICNWTKQVQINSPLP